MRRDNEHDPDPNVNAARIVGETIEAGGDDLRHASDNPEVEAAWKAWSGCIQKVGDRTMTLLRAAFEAGWEAAHP